MLRLIDHFAYVAGADWPFFPGISGFARQARSNFVERLSILTYDEFGVSLAALLRRAAIDHKSPPA